MYVSGVVVLPSVMPLIGCPVVLTVGSLTFRWVSGVIATWVTPKICQTGELEESLYMTTVALDDPELERLSRLLAEVDESLDPSAGTTLLIVTVDVEPVKAEAVARARRVPPEPPPPIRTIAHRVDVPESAQRICAPDDPH